MGAGRRLFAQVDAAMAGVSLTPDRAPRPPTQPRRRSRRGRARSPWVGRAVACQGFGVELGTGDHLSSTRVRASATCLEGAHQPFDLVGAVVWTDSARPPSSVASWSESGAPRLKPFFESTRISFVMDEGEPVTPFHVERRDRASSAIAPGSTRSTTGLQRVRLVWRCLAPPAGVPHSSELHVLHLAALPRLFHVKRASASLLVPAVLIARPGRNCCPKQSFVFNPRRARGVGLE